MSLVVLFNARVLSSLSQEEEGEETTESGSSTQEEEESAMVQRSELVRGASIPILHVHCIYTFYFLLSFLFSVSDTQLPTFLLFSLPYSPVLVCLSPPVLSIPPSLLLHLLPFTLDHTHNPQNRFFKLVNRQPLPLVPKQ